jgi:uncharacterized integral membrane protein (TIGR00698 family)
MTQKNARLPFFIFLSLGCLIPGVTTPLALASGIAFGMSFGCPEKQKVSNLSKWLLQFSVVGLGFGIPFAEVLSAGREGLLLSFVTILLALTAGTLLSKLLGVKSRTGTLISVGTAICGGSAIAAIAPVIHADQDDISVSMAVVFTLNSLALFLFPWIGHHLHLLPEQFGLWSALAIHDTSSVVGASSLFGEKALAIASTVKLSRAMWILPLVIFFTMVKRAKGKIAIPWFIFLFVVAAALGSFFPEYKSTFSTLSTFAKQALCLVLF